MSLRDWWNRMLSDRRDTATEHATEREKQTADEREHVSESADELEADEFAGGHLGGIDPGRLLDDGRPRPEDEPPR